MLRLVSKKEVPLTLELARQFANMERSPGECEYSPSHVNWLKQKFYEGLLYAPTWGLYRSKGSTVSVRVNGQHSSSMYCQLPKEDFPKGATVTMHEWEGDKHDDLVECFQQYDQSNVSRASSDTYWAHRAQFPELVKVESLTRTKLGVIVDGLSYFYSRVMRVRKCTTPNEKGKLIAVHPDFVAAVSPIVDSKLLKGRSVIAAMLATHIKSGAALDKFWTAVRDGSNPDPEHPTRKLGDLLKEVVGMTKEKRLAQYRTTNDGIYHACVHAWNAWRDGRRTGLHVYKDKDFPDPK